MKKPALVILASLLVVLAPLAQQLPAEAEADLKLAAAGFECSVLAASSDLYQASASPLAAIALDASVRGYPEMIALMRQNTDSMGPLAGFLTNASPEFFAGLAFAEASKKITAQIEDQYPVDGPYDFKALMDLRKSAANIEFADRNCQYVR